MSTLKLEVQTRDGKTKAKQLRREKKIPLVFYGKNTPARHFICEYESFRKLYRTAGENTLIDLMDEGKKIADILIQEVQMDPVSDRYSHIDVIHVNMNEEITTMVPILLEGVAPAIKEVGGTLIQNLQELEVRCLPANIPHEIKGSVVNLVDFNSSLHVSDLIIPSGVKVLNDPDQTVAVITAVQEEKAPEIVTEVAPEAGKEGTTPTKGATPTTGEGNKGEVKKTEAKK